MIPRTRGLAAWAALLAMALQALWPLLAQAKPRAVTLVPVCTIDGVTHYLELKAGETPLEKRTATDHEHCAFCSFDSGRTAVLPSAPRTLLPSATVGVAVREKTATAIPSRRHPTAPPRAPPAGFLS